MMKRVFKRSFNLFVIVFLFYCTTHGQQGTNSFEDKRISAGVIAGIGLPFKGSGIANSYGAWIHYGMMTIGSRYINNGEPLGPGGGYAPLDPVLPLEDWALLMGISIPLNESMILLTIGPSVVQGTASFTRGETVTLPGGPFFGPTTRTNWYCNNFHSTGLALDAKLFIPTFDWAGMGVQIYANRNSHYSFWGGNLTLCFGFLGQMGSQD